MADRLARPRAGLLVPVVVAMAASAIFLWPKDVPTSVGTDEAPDTVTADATSENIAASAGRVRIALAREESPPPERGGEHPALRLLAEVEHEGPLEGEDRARLLSHFAHQQRKIEQKLASSRADPRDSEELLAEARLLWKAALSKASIEAVERGSYVTTGPGKDSPPLTLPGAEVVRLVGVLRNGQPVNVTIIMPLRSHPKLADAVEYRKGVRAFDDSERARRFNALPDAERLPLAKEIARILRKPDRTQGEIRFVRKWIGVHTTLSESQGLVFLTDQD